MADKKEPKAYQQFLQVQKEDEDETWISGEELRTEGSSDEEAPRRRLKPKKSRARRSSETTIHPDPKIYLPDIYKNNKVGITIKCTEPGPSRAPFRPPEADEVYFDEELERVDPSMSLEERLMRNKMEWRPKRGARQLPKLVEEQTTDNFVHEINSFYDGMAQKLKLLKNTTVLTNEIDLIDDVDFDEEQIFNEQEFKKLYKNVKYTPDMQETLQKIKKMDNDISGQFNLYREQRKLRLETQKEMCYKLSEVTEKNAQLFLGLCKFERDNPENVSYNGDGDSVENSDVHYKRFKKTSNGKIVDRNILVAKNSIIQYSLTDDEKKRLRLIMHDDLEGYVENKEVPTETSLEVKNVTPESNTENVTETSLNLNEENEDPYQRCILNAFQFNEMDKAKMDHINEQLKLFGTYPAPEDIFETKDSKELQNETKRVVYPQPKCEEVPPEPEEEEEIRPPFIFHLDKKTEKVEKHVRFLLNDIDAKLNDLSQEYQQGQKDLRDSQIDRVKEKVNDSEQDLSRTMSQETILSNMAKTDEEFEKC